MNNEIKLYSVTSGFIQDISKANDNVFSSKLLGCGMVIEPKSNNIFSPVDGEVSLVLDTKHALAIKARNGTEILIHCGIDTVKLNGQGFTTFVKKGETVKAGQKILECDLDFLNRNGYNTQTVIIVTKTDEKNVSFIESKNVNKEDIIMVINN